MSTFLKMETENQFMFVSITRYAQLCGITRESVCKRLKSGKAKTLDLCEVKVIDLANSKGTDDRNNWKDIEPEKQLPF